MKMTYRYIGFMLLLVSPLFSALLTEDHGVVSPTGIPLYHYDYEIVKHSCNSNHLIKIRFLESSKGIFLIREHTRGGVSLLSSPLSNAKVNLTITRSPSEKNQ